MGVDMERMEVDLQHLLKLQYEGQVQIWIWMKFNVIVIIIIIMKTFPVTHIWHNSKVLTTLAVSIGTGFTLLWCRLFSTYSERPRWTWTCFFIFSMQNSMESDLLTMSWYCLAVRRSFWCLFSTENIFNAEYNFSVLYTFQNNPRNSFKLWHTMSANAQFHFEFSVWVLNSENNLLYFYIYTFVYQLLPMLIFKSLTWPGGR